MAQATVVESIPASKTRETISCQICGRLNAEPSFWKKDRFGFDKDPYAIVRCPSCDYFYVNPRPLPENLLKYYPDTYSFQEKEPDNKRVSFFTKLEALYRNQGLSYDVRRILAVTGKRSGRVLEIGCGTGDRLRLFESKGFEVSGIEPAAAAREYGRQHFNLTILDAKLEEWKGPKEPQDIICMFNVLEHLPYPMRELPRLVSWLKDDGVLVIQVPDSACLVRRFFRQKWASMDVPRDIFYFSNAAMRVALRKAGLNIVKIEYGHHWMHPPTLISTVFPQLDPGIIWKEKNPAVSVSKKLLWAGATLLGIPVALLGRLLKQSSLMTIYAKPESPQVSTGKNT